MAKRKRSQLEAESLQLEKCQQRLALSASLGAGVLIETLDAGGEDLSPDLAEQASQLRASAGLDGSGQTAVVIDSGIAYDHVAFGGGFGPGYRVVGGWDFAENDADPYDDGPAGYHGSHVAGLLGGESDAVTGVAPGADLVALRVFDDNGGGSLEWIESALQWVHENQDAFENPITTVNLSVGAELSDTNYAYAMELLEDEFAALREDNILVFAAAGNNFSSLSEGQQGELLYPASSPNVIAVSSVDDGGQLSDFAQRESGILATRGETLSSAVPDHVFGWDGKTDDIASLSGTSQATPQLAGAAMLIRQALVEQGIEPTADAIMQRLNESGVEQTDAVTGATYRAINLVHAVSIHDVAPGVGEAELPTTPTIDGFTGTNATDDIELDLREGTKLRVNGVEYDLVHGDPADLPAVIDVGGGDDSLRIIGSPGNDRLVMHADGDQSGLLTSGGRQIELRGFERVSFDGGGGSDRATLFDSAGDDSLRSHPNAATLSGVGYEFVVSNVSRIYVHGTAGGDDTAFLHDSAGDDKLAVRPQFTSLRGEDSFQLAYGFERVYAYAKAGGYDTADLYDSEGDDTINVSASRSIISGENYQVAARDFESVIGHATSGGNDVARIYVSEDAGSWSSTSDRVQWNGEDGSVRIARGFERAEIFENYKPVEIQTQSALPIQSDDNQVRIENENAAMRQVFEDLWRHMDGPTPIAEENPSEESDEDDPTKDWIR